MTNDKKFEDKHAEGWYPFEPINEASAWAKNFIDTVQHVELNAATSNAEDIVRNLRFMAAAAGYEAGAEAARPKWIKCSERMPTKEEQDGGVIWLDPLEEQIYMGRLESYDGKRLWVGKRNEWECAIPLYELTHWAKMPALPEEEESK